MDRVLAVEIGQQPAPAPAVWVHAGGGVMEAPKPEPGDWIRFYRDGRMSIGVVQYVRAASSWLSGNWRCDTDHGELGDDDILELRRRDGASWVRA